MAVNLSARQFRQQDMAALVRDVLAETGLDAKHLVSCSPLLPLPGLRTWQVSKFPLLWFYVERNDRLDVVRLLGERQDIAAILAEGG